MTSDPSEPAPAPVDAPVGATLRRWTGWPLWAAIATTAAAVLLMAETRVDAPASLPPIEPASSLAPLPMPSLPVALPTAAASRDMEIEAPPPESMQLCGGDWVRTLPDGSLDEAAMVALPSVRDGMTRIVTRLRSSPDALGKATALLLDLVATASMGAQPARDDTAKCEAACLQARIEDERRERANRMEPLVRLAIETQDPKVYALAYRMCPQPIEAGACRLLSAEQWARIDADNAVPWLYLAGQSSERGDHAARDEALFRIGAAEGYRTYWLVATARMIDEAAHEDALLVPAQVLAPGLVGIEVAGASPNLALLTRACRDVTLDSDPNRWQLCSAAAERLAERSDTTIDRMVGIGMARRLGWSDERTDRLLGEVVDSRRAESVYGRAADPRIGRDCVAARRFLTDLASRGHLGEMAALRASLGASAASPSDYPRIGRLERERREASRRAEAASTPAVRSAAASAPVEAASEPATRTAEASASIDSVR